LRVVQALHQLTRVSVAQVGKIISFAIPSMSVDVKVPHVFVGHCGLGIRRPGNGSKSGLWLRVDFRELRALGDGHFHEHSPLQG